MEMWSILVLSFVTIASSRTVPYDDNGDIMALMTVFGIGNSHSTEDSNHSDLPQQGKMVHSNPGYRQVRVETSAPIMDQHKHWHGIHGDVKRDEGNNISNNVNEETYNIDNIRTPVNQRTKLNTQRTKNTSTINPETSPVTKQIILTNIKTANDTKRKPDSIEGVNKNITNIISLTSRQLIDGNTTLKAKRNNSLDMEGDRRVWEDSTTTTKRSTFSLENRTVLTGDKCATKQVRFGYKCIDED